MKNAKLSLAFALALIVSLTSPAFAQSQPYPGGGSTSGGGTGDFSGPSSSTADNFLGFANTGGKLGKDSTYGPASFAPPGKVVLVTGSNPTLVAGDWAAWTQYTITGTGRTITQLSTAAPLDAKGGNQIDTNLFGVTYKANASDVIKYNGTTTASGGSVSLPQGGFFTVTADVTNHIIYISGPPGSGGNSTSTSPQSFLAGNTYIAVPFGTTGTHQNQNTIWFTPVIVPVGKTITSIYSLVTIVQAGGNAQFQVYANDPATNGPVGAPLCSSNVSQSTAGLGITTSSCGAVATTQIMWLASNQDNSVATLWAINNGNPWTSWLVGTPNATDIYNVAANVGTAFTLSSTFNTWPTISTPSSVARAKVAFGQIPNLAYLIN